MWDCGGGVRLTLPPLISDTLVHNWMVPVKAEIQVKQLVEIGLAEKNDLLGATAGLAR